MYCSKQCLSYYYVDRVRYLTCLQLVSSATRIDFYSREYSETPDICLLARKLSHMPASTYPVPYPIQSPPRPGFLPPQAVPIVHAGHDGRTPRVPSSPRQGGRSVSQRIGRHKQGSPAPFHRLRILVKSMSIVGEQR